MKLEHVLLTILLMMAVVVTILATIEQPPHATGLPHPDHGAMAIGGEAISRSAAILPWGLAFALLQVCLFGGLLLLGLRRGVERVLPRYLPVVFGLSLLALAFVFLFSAYSSYAENPAASPIVFGFPAPSAWMLFGVWWTPLFLIVLYHRKFEAWVFSSADEAAFRELLADLKPEADAASLGRDVNDSTAE